MKDLKDFDVTQINKDTKVVVLKINFSQLCDNVLAHLKHIDSKLSEVGIKLVVVDKSIDIVPLTEELLNSGKLKEI